jgi:hypothetical protein
MLTLTSRTQARRRSREDSHALVQTLVAMGLFCVTTLALLAAPVPTGKPGNYPAWWFSRNVIAQKNPTNASPAWPTNYPTSDDYSGINQGQLKNMATAAYNELVAQLPSSSVWYTPQGYALSSLITSWNPAAGDSYAGVNLGQLKTVAKPFYDVLIQMGYTNAYPWTGTGADDYAGANIGQAKNVFKFDVSVDTDNNGLPDWWEMHYFGHLGNVGSSQSPAGDGYTLAQEYQYGRNPNDFYQGVAPTITVMGGGNQLGAPSTRLTIPLSLTVNSGASNAPLTITVTQGTALLATSPTGSTSTSLSLRTAYVSGVGYAVQVYLKTGTTVSDFSTITITAPGYSANATTTTVACYDSSIAGPTNLVATNTSPTTINLSWTNHSTNGTIIEQSSDNGATWQIIATVASGISTYTVTGLTPDMPVIFQVFAASAGGGGTGGGSSGGGGSAPPPATPPVTPLSQPTLVGETQYAYLPKYGFAGFVTTTNRYLQQVVSTSATDTDGNGDGGSSTTTTTYNAVTGQVTTSTTGNSGASNFGSYGGSSHIISDTQQTQHGVDSDGSGETS